MAKSFVVGVRNGNVRLTNIVRGSVERAGRRGCGPQLRLLVPVRNKGRDASGEGSREDTTGTRQRPVCEAEKKTSVGGRPQGEPRKETGPALLCIYERRQDPQHGFLRVDRCVELDALRTTLVAFIQKYENQRHQS